MVALQGYYDGNAVRTLEHINAKKNQKPDDSSGFFDR